MLAERLAAIAAEQHAVMQAERLADTAAVVLLVADSVAAAAVAVAAAMAAVDTANI
jgi:hypothetical protein